MTTATDGRPLDASGRQQPADPLVVRPSRRRIWRDMAITAVFVIVAVAAVLNGPPDGLWRRVVLVVVLPTALGWQIRLRRGLLAADALLEGGSAGIRVDHLGRGWVTLPWSAVGRVTPNLVGSSVVVRVAPGDGPSTPGTMWPPEDPDLRWRRWRGFRPTAAQRPSGAPARSTVVLVRWAAPDATEDNQERVLGCCGSRSGGAEGFSVVRGRESATDPNQEPQNATEDNQERVPGCWASRRADAQAQDGPSRRSGSPTRSGFPPAPTGQDGAVTAPVSWTSTPPASAAPASGPPPLVVRPDRRKVRRILALVLGANGVVGVVCLLAAVWASSATGEWWAGAATGITLAGAVFQMVFHAFFYGRVLGTPAIAEIGPDGVQGLTSRWVPRSLPWSSVVSVARSWNSMVVTPVAGAGPKILIPLRGIDTDAATIRAAVAHFSGGRL